MITASGTKNASLGMCKILKDGTKVNFGVMAYQHKNPLKHWAVNLWISAKVLYFKARGYL